MGSEWEGCETGLWAILRRLGTYALTSSVDTNWCAVTVFSSSNVTAGIP